MKRQKIKRGASQTYDTPSFLLLKLLKEIGYVVGKDRICS